jgi:hypothetical protein
MNNRAVSVSTKDVPWSGDNGQEKGTFYFSVDLRAVEEEQLRAWPLSTEEGRLGGGGLGRPDRQAVGPGN